jgi:gluconolactonase
MLTAACGDDGGAEPVDPARDGGLDARIDGSEPSELDARARDAAIDGAIEVVEDASAADAAMRSDAAAPLDDAGAQSLRQRVCGDRSEWPDPLPAPGMRTAAAVGDARFGFIEGPVWIDSLGVLLFSDMNFGGDDANGPPSKIRRLRSPSSFDELAANAGSNGLALWGEDLVLAATHDRRSLTFFNPQSGIRTNFVVTYQGHAFNSPNDLAIREDGWVYFSDPDYQLGDREEEIGNGETNVYRVKLSFPPPASVDAQLVDDDYTQPNGVALSPDQKTLYVGSSGNQIFKYTVNPDGSLGEKTRFATPGASDGLGVDCAGNVYVTAGKVQVFAPTGTKLGEINVGEGPSNVAFGGTDHQTLYITARTRLYAIELNVPGLPY